MDYKWKDHGDTENPVIALIAPSNCFDQDVINARIEKLKNMGFCVKVPTFEDGSEDGVNLVEPDLEERKESNRMSNSFSPAVSAEKGAKQIIHCIENGINIMPFMGGDSFKEKIPLILEHFSTHPLDASKPLITIFGMSDSTYATLLASHGLCHFVSTPFTNIFLRQDENLSTAKQRLESLLKGEEVESFPRKILHDPSNKLADIGVTFHHPFNIGTIVEGAQFLNIPRDQKWSFSVEGFLQRPGNEKLVNYPYLLNEFLNKHQGNKPAFIEIGNIATRLDGSNGYTNLLHDENDGKILINSYNIDKILAAKKSETIESVIETLESQNFQIEALTNALKNVAAHHKIPLIYNPKNGHCANMDIVRGGLIRTRVLDQQVMITTEPTSKQMPVSETLNQISQDQNFRGIVAASGHEVILNVDGLTTQTPFKTHSVGKIFSGVLMAEMLAQDVIDENDLTKIGIELPTEVSEKLSQQPEVLERLSSVSILQAMTHKANLGDNLDNYLERFYRGESVPNSMDGLLDLVTNNWKKNYSNDGLLLGGIALQHLYNQRTGENLSYEDLLKKFVINPSGANISMTTPAGAYHDENMVDFPASPAGGHYASIDDLQKFSAHLQRRCQDPHFMAIIEKYGSEFYDKEKNMIAHKGDFEGNTPDAPGSATGFAVFLDDGKTIALFNSIDASLNDRINRTMTKCHGHRFFDALVDGIAEEKESQKWTQRFVKNKAAEAEDLGRKKSDSWKKILDQSGSSKDDSGITR